MQGKINENSIFRTASKLLPINLSSDRKTGENKISAIQLLIVMKLCSEQKGRRNSITSKVTGKIVFEVLLTVKHRLSFKRQIKSGRKRAH